MIVKLLFSDVLNVKTSETYKTEKVKCLIFEEITVILNEKDILFHFYCGKILENQFQKKQILRLLFFLYFFFLRVILH